MVRKTLFSHREIGWKSVTLLRVCVSLSSSVWPWPMAMVMLLKHTKLVEFAKEEGFSLGLHNLLDDNTVTFPFVIFKNSASNLGIKSRQIVWRTTCLLFNQFAPTKRC